MYTYQATNRSVYLPKLDANHTWIYWYNQSSVGQGGSRITVPTPISEFPLFVIRPIEPPSFANATSLFDSQRGDQVLCAGSDCYGANTYYTTLSVEGVAVISNPSGATISVNGTSYTLTPLTLWFSPVHNDNFVATNSTPPDSTYLPSNKGTEFQNGYVLTSQAPGTLPLQVWFKQGQGQSWDYATVATPEGVAWAQSNGYTFRYQSGYVFKYPLPTVVGW